jgi:hypothetical protein
MADINLDFLLIHLSKYKNITIASGSHSLLINNLSSKIATVSSRAQYRFCSAPGPRSYYFSKSEMISSLELCPQSCKYCEENGQCLTCLEGFYPYFDRESNKKLCRNCENTLPESSTCKLIKTKKGWNDLTPVDLKLLKDYPAYQMAEYLTGIILVPITCKQGYFLNQH